MHCMTSPIAHPGRRGSREQSSTLRAAAAVRRRRTAGAPNLRGQNQRYGGPRRSAAAGCVSVAVADVPERPAQGQARESSSTRRTTSARSNTVQRRPIPKSSTMKRNGTRGMFRGCVRRRCGSSTTRGEQTLLQVPNHVERAEQRRESARSTACTASPGAVSRWLEKAKEHLVADRTSSTKSCTAGPG